tara:strand:- start:206 stop:688 length:483 start_codon:yes stop_codon:yes gene_type:complete
MKRITILLIFLASSVFADKALTIEERVVALTILGEARGEGEKGMSAVACVIQTRAKERGLTPLQVCHEYRQFDTWWVSSGRQWSLKKERELYYLWRSPSKIYARELARKVCNKKVKLEDITNGANHFCRTTSFPYWTRGKTPVFVYKKHKFFKLPPPRKK